MYKISQVAEILNVPTVKIHEKLISLRKDLKECIHKKNSITYIDDKGLIIIKKAFESEVTDKVSVVDRTSEKKADELLESQEDATNELTEIESSYDLKVIELKEKIGQSKSQLSKLDIELKRMDDAIVHYQEILKDDMNWRIAAEKKLEDLKSKPLSEDLNEPEEPVKQEKKGFFSSFISK